MRSCDEPQESVAARLLALRRFATPRTKRVVAVALLLVAAGFAGLEIWDRRSSLAEGWDRLPAVALLAAFAAGVASTYCTMLAWRTVLREFDAPLPLGGAARVFFIGQLGKYLPGSVWPILAQMELARRHNIARRVMAAGSSLLMLLNLAVGVLIACWLLPFTSPSAIDRYWWVFLCIPPLLISLHPRVVEMVANRVLAVLGRRPLPVRLRLSGETRAAAWGALAWLLLGVHVYALAYGLGARGLESFAVSITAACLSMCAGILLVPVPAGAGVREVALVATLSPVLSTSDALLVALLSRALLVLVDVALAGFGALSDRGRQHVAGRPRPRPASRS
ncbi:MAG TPA: lysylphosphatidylglycerol synthase domain-containing protein [Candidatus Limnocylindria bacterium]|nr:lysylphosphatidylglycerol synthase domain-containing protein [Candidatus Limnocylindria bacterium]